MTELIEDLEVRDMTTAEVLAYEKGFLRAVWLFGIYKEDQRYIGALNTNVKDVGERLRREVMEHEAGRATDGARRLGG